MADREPTGGAGRPSDEMQSARPPLATPHASHDLVVLAAAADRDADPGARAAAAGQVAACPDCAAIAAELGSLAAGLGHLPTSRPAPRDMRISAERAARLRRGGLWRRLLRPFGEGRLPVLRPLAATLTTIGLVGLLVSALPPGFGAAGGAAILAPVGDAIGSPIGPQASSAPVPAAAATGGVEQQGSGAKGATAAPGQPPATAPGTAEFGADSERSNASHAFALIGGAPSLPPLAWISLGLVGLGLGLLTLLFAARRIT